MVENSNDIAVWFLVLSLLFPRITLLIAWCNNCIPLNTIPFWGDFFMTIFIPRILILIYIGTNMGCDSGWFWVHIVAAIFAYLCNAYAYNEKFNK
jgi:hypothetical protein